MQEAPEDIFAMTSSINNAPDSPQDIEIFFKNGLPVAINNQFLTPVGSFRKLMILQVNMVLEE